MSRPPVPVTWRDAAEHRRKLADGVNYLLRRTSNYSDVIDLTNGGADDTAAWNFYPPDTATRISILIDQASLSGTESIDILLGDSGGVETTGYVGDICTSTGGAFALSSSFEIARSDSALRTFVGSFDLELLDRSTNTWIARWIMSRTGSVVGFFGSGSKSLTGALTQVQLKSAGTNNFDNGKAVMRYF